MIENLPQIFADNFFLLSANKGFCLAVDKDKVPVIIYGDKDIADAVKNSIVGIKRL